MHAERYKDYDEQKETDEVANDPKANDYKRRLGLIDDDEGNSQTNLDILTEEEAKKAKDALMRHEWKKKKVT